MTNKLKSVATSSFVDGLEQFSSSTRAGGWGGDCELLRQAAARGTDAFPLDLLPKHGPLLVT
jgi:hypothetical protein